MGKRKEVEEVHDGGPCECEEDTERDASRVEELETEVEELHDKVGELLEAIADLEAEVVAVKVAAFDMVQAMFEE